MTEPIHVLILNALLTKLTSPALTSPVTPIAHPLVAYVPVIGTPYLHAHPVLRAEPDAPFVAFDADVTHRGIFQVDAVMPDGAGEAPGIRLASLVAARFAIGTTLDLTGGGRLKITRPATIAPAVKDAPWVRFPVSIPWWISVA